MTLADSIAAYALTLKGKLYGSRLPGGNGMSQRGPDSFDCIGLVRDVLLHAAPQLWPGNRGGQDSWTVPNFLEWWERLHLGAVVVPSATERPRKGDLMIWCDLPAKGQRNGTPRHIGVVLGDSEAISAYGGDKYGKPGVITHSIGIVALRHPCELILRTQAGSQSQPIKATATGKNSHIYNPVTKRPTWFGFSAGRVFELIAIPGGWYSITDSSHRGYLIKAGDPAWIVANDPRYS